MKSKYTKGQRVMAIIGIIILVGLYLSTLVFSILDIDGTGRMFITSVFATIAIPILIWIYVWLYGQFTNKKTMASFEVDESEGEK